MKRHFYTLGLMLAATFTLTNCAQEIDNPNDVPSAGIPFEIVATSAETKTVNDGLITKWVADDQINIFHAVAETNTYVSDGAFTVAEADVATGRFTGTLSSALESDKVYDWYALYPYSEHVTTPGKHDKGYTYIGHSKGLNQSGYDSMASLKGSVCPLYGIATAVPEGTKPSMTMNHISSIVAINVTNATEEALTVSTASLTAEEDIVGSYFIDITKSPVVCTPSGANYVNNTATVNVSGGTELAQGESAILYLAIKPFTAATGKKLVISVNGYSKELTMTKDVTFTAGKIKTLNFSYDKVAEPEGTNVTWDLTKADHDSAEASEVVWKSDFVTMTLIQNSSSTPANNYLGGTNAHTRVYKDQILSLEPKASVTIQKIEFNVLSSYMDEFEGASWTNGNATTSGLVRTVVPTDESKTVSVTFSAATRFTSVKVYYTVDEDYVPPTLESIAVSGDYKTEFTQGATFSFGGVVTATYDDESTRNVTDDCTFSGYNMSTVGEQTVTVTYKGKTTDYKITVSEEPQGGGDDSEDTIYVFLASDLTAGTSFNTGTVNNAIAYKLGSSSKIGTLTFPAGYSTITFYAVGWSSGTNTLSVQNGTINGSDSVTLTNDDIASGTINNGFSKSGTFNDNYKYTISVTNTSSKVVLSLKRGIVWGFEGVSAN